MKKVKVLFGSLLLAGALFLGVNALMPGTAEAQDCSNNSVIKCGVTSISQLRSRYNNDTTPGTRNIYAAYGLTSNIINHGTYKVGTTTKSGDVIVDGKVVATGAHSAGRQFIAGSTKHTYKGTTYYDRPNSVSYRSNTISAIVFFDAHGQFIAAVLYDCGNPVAAKPKPVPVYSCTQLSKLALSRDKYQFTAHATAKNGAKVKNYTFNFGDGSTATTGAKATHTYKKAGTYTVTVKVNVSVNGKTKSVSSTKCKVKVAIAPAPVYSCDQLSAKKLTRTDFSFTTKATAKNGAKIKNFTYNFGDGTTKTTGAKVTHSYKKAGTYTVTVTAHIVVNGKTVNVTGKCKTKVCVTPAPVYTCDELSAKRISRTNFTFTTKATAKNGAKVKNYTYNFGDGTTKTTSSVVNHGYTKVGTYTVTVKVNVSVNGKTTAVSSNNCKVKVTVHPEMCPVPGKEQYPKDDKRCFVNKPSVTIEKLVNGKDRDEVATNTHFTYTVIVTNTGNITLKNLVVTDAAPAGVTFVSSPDGTISHNKWSATLKSLAVGKSHRFTIIATLPAYKAGDIVNQACVETPTVPGGHPDACDTVPVTTPKLVKVCNTRTNEIEVVNKADIDSSYMTTDLTKCETTPTPPELPHTGTSDSILSVLGLGSLVGVSVAYLASRRR